MMLTRRSLLGSGAALATAAAVAQSLAHEPAVALADTPCQALPAASPAVVAMSSLSNGISARDLGAFNALGSTPDERYERWVDQQLNPASIDDSGAPFSSSKTVTEPDEAGGKAARSPNSVSLVGQAIRFK